MPDIPLPRLRFAHLPTPIEPLKRLSGQLGDARLWIKRDDQTGLAFGGNKTRKLEYLLAEAQSHGAQTLITRGAAQSNHCRQTAAAAARFGLDCILVLAGNATDKRSGNLLLDALLNAELVWTEGADPEAVMQQTFEQAWNEGRRPYLVPYGGSNPTGAAAYSAAFQELLSQDLLPDTIVLASSSGGTQAGLLVGARSANFKGQIIGISVEPPASELAATIASLANQTADLLRSQHEFTPDEVNVVDDYLGEGYGKVSALERQAIKRFAQFEGIILDPVYTGRAAGGMLDMIQAERISPKGNILFWHTGGTPAVFVYGDGLT